MFWIHPIHDRSQDINVAIRSKVVLVGAWMGFRFNRWLYSIVPSEKTRIAQTAETAPTGELSLLPKTAAWGTGELERIEP